MKGHSGSCVFLFFPSFTPGEFFFRYLHPPASMAPDWGVAGSVCGAPFLAWRLGGTTMIRFEFHFRVRRLKLGWFEGKLPIFGVPGLKAQLVRTHSSGTTWVGEKTANHGSLSWATLFSLPEFVHFMLGVFVLFRGRPF